MMYLRSALGAALLAVPLVGAAGQSASQHDQPARPAGDSTGGHRFAWVVGAGATGAAVFTTFVRLSERGASVSAERGLTIPNSPVPNHYTDGSLPGSGVSPGQNTPPPGPTLPPGPNTGATGDQTTGPGTVDQPGPVVLDQPPADTTDTYVPTDPVDDGQTNPTPPSPNKFPVTAAIVVTTPEPEALFLLGTGLIPLVPMLRRRKSSS